MAGFETGSSATESVEYPTAPSTAWEVHKYKRGEKQGELGDIAFEYLIQMRDGGEAQTKHYIYYWKDEGGIYESPLEYTVDVSAPQVGGDQANTPDATTSRADTQKNYADLDEAFTDLYPIALPGDRTRTRSTLPGADKSTHVAWIGKDKETGEKKILEADDAVPDGGTYTVPRRGTFTWKDGRWTPTTARTADAPKAAPPAPAPAADPVIPPAPAPAPRTPDPIVPPAAVIPPIPVITEEMRAGMTSAQMEELLKQIRAQNDAREALLASQAAGNAALDYLKIKDPEAGATLAATWEHFKPQAGQSAEELAANAKVFKTIEKRRFAVFKEGQRVTSPEGVKAIGDAIKNYQAQPWYVRWGLGGAMMHGLAGMGGATALSALGVIGCLTSPALAGIGIGAATRELVYRWFKRRKDTGADKGMLTKSPHVTGAIIASLFGYGASLAIGPDGIDAIGNFFSKLIKDPSSTLRSLLSLSFLGKKAAVVGATI